LDRHRFWSDEPALTLALAVDPTTCVTLHARNVTDVLKTASAAQSWMATNSGIPRKDCPQKHALARSAERYANIREDFVRAQTFARKDRHGLPLTWDRERVCRRDG